MRRTSADFTFVFGIFFITIFAFFSVHGQETASEFVGNNDGQVMNKNRKPAASQTSEAFDKKNELSVLGGFALRRLGNLRKSNFGFAAVRYSRRVASSETLTLKYQIDFLPLTVVDYDKQQLIKTAPATFMVRTERAIVYGAGFTPFGLQLNFRRRKRIQPFAAVIGGLIYSAKSIPDDRTAAFPNRFGTHLNFATGAGGGVEIETESKRAVAVGYRFQHISNASRGNINPGFNQNIFYLGYTFKKW